MTKTLRLASSIPKPSLPNDASRVITALWGLRVAVNHENGMEWATRSTWLHLVGDCVEWPLDLLDEFIRLSVKDSGGNQPHRIRPKRNKKVICWNDAFDCFVEAYSKQPILFNKYFIKSINQLEQHWLAICDRDIIWKNIMFVGDLQYLNGLERKLLLCYVYLDDSRSPLHDFLEDIELGSIPQAIEIMASMFDSTPELITDAVHRNSPLMANGLIYRASRVYLWFNFINVSKCLKTALVYPNKTPNDLVRNFTAEATPGHLGVDDIPHLLDSLQWLTDIISNALITRESGVNVLLYGAPGTGKTEFAKLLAGQVGAMLYEVSFMDSNGDPVCSQDRYVSLLMSQSFLSARNDCLLLFDEVDDAIEANGATDEFDQPYKNCKASVNHQLEHNPIPIIWICNDLRFFSAAQLRRFLFHLEFRMPPRVVRQRIAERYLAQFNISESLIKNVSQHAHLSPAQIENTARLLKLHKGHDVSESEILIEKAIRQSMSAMNQSVAKKPVKPITPYRLDYLNIDTPVPMERIVDAIRKRPVASLCFYGPSGTGKSQLAEYLSGHTGLNLIVKCASDLLSKWVGETEQNIATMFKNASEEQSIIFLDEADSFLRSRMVMTRNFEASPVNELLQQMEHFDGIFICATNLFEQFDQAAFRRFTFKVRFGYLKPEQRAALFAESLQLTKFIVSAEHQRRLQKLDQLTPGDYATVLRQVHILGEKLTADEFIDQLENECAAKNGGRIQRGIGFT